MLSGAAAEVTSSAALHCGAPLPRRCGHLPVRPAHEGPGHAGCQRPHPVPCQSLTQNRIQSTHSIFLPLSCSVLHCCCGFALSFKTIRGQLSNFDIHWTLTYRKLHGHVTVGACHGVVPQEVWSWYQCIHLCSRQAFPDMANFPCDYLVHAEKSSRA